MNTLTKIACRTVGAAGIGIALYDAVKLGGHYSKVRGNIAEANHLTKVHSSGRTTDNISYVDNFIREKTVDMRNKNGIHKILGCIGGGFEGAMYGLANHLPAIVCSAFAILGKGIGAKLGSIGVGLCLLYKIVKEGFGIGKPNPMN